jgi:putative transposase
MRKSRFTDRQVIEMIKEQEAGVATSEVCRKHGLSPATFYKLKGRFSWMELSDARRLKALEDENAKLKRLLADTTLDSVVLEDLLESTDGEPWRRHAFEADGERRSGGTRRLGCCGTTRSRGAGRAGLAASIQRRSGATARRTM